MFISFQSLTGAVFSKANHFFLYRHIHQSEAAIQEISSMLTAPIGTYILTPMCMFYPGTGPGRVCILTFVFWKKKLHCTFLLVPTFPKYVTRI